MPANDLSAKALMRSGIPRDKGLSEGRDGWIPQPHALRPVSCLVILILLCCLFASCKKNFEISLRACLLEGDEPREGAVLPYSKRGVDESARRASPGPFIVVLFSTPTDLEALGRRKHIHNLYYSVFACNSADLDANLCDGDVYKLTGKESERLLGRRDKAGENLYKVYIPNSLKVIGRHAEVFRSMNVPDELEKVRRFGLCMAIGGGNMLGGGIWSNPLQIPVVVTADSLEINHRTEMPTATPDVTENPGE